MDLSCAFLRSSLQLSSDVASFPSLLEAAGAVAKSFNGNVIVVVKGEADIISDGEKCKVT